MKAGANDKQIVTEKKLSFTQKASLFFSAVYNVYRFIVLFFKEAFTRPFEFKEIINQCYEVGYRSLPLVSLTGFITGIVFSKHSISVFSIFIFCRRRPNTLIYTLAIHTSAKPAII